VRYDDLSSEFNRPQLGASVKPLLGDVEPSTFLPLSQLESLEERHTNAISNLSELRVRTANHDNYKDRKEILKIFASHYLHSHPLPQVLSEEFWICPEKYLMGETITSLILEDIRTGER